uniref:Delta(3,5)-Delta(2,4)-dienoyl-CoA isomerase, mitochondrial n=1 Tax=Plectus sambesii TaxID=2011161 RepID=A0A914V4S2_9BILA
MLLRSRCSGVLYRSLSTLPAFEHLLVTEPKKHVAFVQLNRPDKRNSLNPKLWKEIGTVFDHLAEDSDIRSIVLAGSGKAFCAGIDLKEGIAKLTAIFQDDSSDVARKARSLRKLISSFQNDFTAIEKCPKPVISAVHGYCIGAGINVISACDIRYSSSDATFSIKEVDIGIAADVGILNRINKIVGSDSLTRELAYTARDMTAQEAFEYGLVSRVFPTFDDCLSASIALAETIANKSPIAVQGTKLTLNYARDHTIEDSINFILTWNQSQLQSEDLIKSAMAAMSKGKEKAEFANV